MFLRNKLKYALNGNEVKRIVKQRLIKVDGKVRTDPTFPAGLMGKLAFATRFLRKSAMMVKGLISDGIGH